MKKKYVIRISVCILYIIYFGFFFGLIIGNISWRYIVVGFYIFVRINWVVRIFLMYFKLLMIKSYLFIYGLVFF